MHPLSSAEQSNINCIGNFDAFQERGPSYLGFFKKSYLLLKLITRNEHIRVEQYVQNRHLFHWYLCHNLNHGKEPEIAFQMITRIYYSPFI